MHASQKAFYKNKNSRTPPGWHFDIDHQFQNDVGSMVPIKSSELSWSYSKVNDEPAEIKIETVKRTPQGTIRKKRNFELDRNLRMKHKPVKHVKFDVDVETGLLQVVYPFPYNGTAFYLVGVTPDGVVSAVQPLPSTASQPTDGQLKAVVRHK